MVRGGEKGWGRRLWERSPVAAASAAVGRSMVSHGGSGWGRGEGSRG